MFKTLKTLLAGILAAVIVIAIGVSAYTAFAAPSTNNFSTQFQIGSMNGNGNVGQNGTGTSVLDIAASDLSAGRSRIPALHARRGKTRPRRIQHTFRDLGNSELLKHCIQ